MDIFKKPANFGVEIVFSPLLAQTHFSKSITSISICCGCCCCVVVIAIASCCCCSEGKIEMLREAKALLMANELQNSITR